MRTFPCPRTPVRLCLSHPGGSGMHRQTAVLTKQEGNHMSIKLKALGLGLLATMAMGAFAVMNAGATTGGHFTFGAHSVEIVGHESKNDETHRVHFLATGGEPGDRIGCDKVEYKGTHTNTANTTTTELTVTPSWSECYTTGNPGTKFEVHENGCDLVFTVRQLPETNDNTVHLKCPAGVKGVTITHPSCDITVPPQTPTGGVAYKTVTENGVHQITLESTAGLTTQYHSGICIFLGTNHTASMTGSVTVTGINTATGQPTSITAT
jgi:hypothetical protein